MAATRRRWPGRSFSAQAISREGVHSAWARCACGMWAGSVAYWSRLRAAWEATRRPLRKISTMVAAQADLDALVHELVGDGVVVVLDGDVVVDVDGGVAPLGQLVARGGQRAQERAVELLEELRGARRRASSAAALSWSSSSRSRR